MEPNHTFNSNMSKWYCWDQLYRGSNQESSSQCLRHTFKCCNWELWTRFAYSDRSWPRASVLGGTAAPSPAIQPSIIAVERSSNWPVVPPDASSPVTERNSKFSASQDLICRCSSPAGVWTKRAARALFPVAKLLASSWISLSFPPVTWCLHVSCRFEFRGSRKKFFRSLQVKYLKKIRSHSFVERQVMLGSQDKRHR